MEEESTNTLLRSTSHPLTRALGEAPEGSALAEKPDMKVASAPPPASAGEWLPLGGEAAPPPHHPHPRHTLSPGSGWSSCLARQGGPVSGSAQVPGNDIALKRVWVGQQQEEALQGISGLPQTPRQPGS